MGKRGPLPKNKLQTDMAQAMPNPVAERRWKAESALNDIERAEGHKRDKSLMKDIKALASEKMENLKKVCK